MERREKKIKILNKDYTDTLIVALVRQGYEVYLSHDSFEPDCAEEVCYLDDNIED